jgi:hypothetical protein
LLDPEPGQQFRIGIFDKETSTTLVFSDAFSSNPIVLPLTPIEVTPWNGTYSVWRFPFSGGSYGYGTANYRFSGAGTFNFSISGTGTLNASTTNDLNNQLNNIANDYNGWNITYPAYRTVVSAGKSPAKAVYFVDQNGVFGWEITTYFDFGIAEYLSSSGPNGGPLMSNQRGWFGSFDLNTTEVGTWLGADFSKIALIEAEITEPGGEKRTILQQDVTIHRDYINSDSPTHPIPDPTYCQTVNSLSDVASVPDARDNLDVYSKGETDAAIAAAGGGGGGSYLPLAGGLMAGPITFDAVGAQNIAKGTFDNSTGGYNGISLTCAVGYELNWQGGHLVSMYASSVQSLIFDSPIWITHAGGITFPDSTSQTTAAVSFNGGTISTGITITGSGGSVTLSDSIGLDLSGSTAGGGLKVGTSGITFSDSTTLTTAPASGPATGELYWMYVDHIDFYGSYCHIHHNAGGGGSNFPRGFLVWSTEYLTSYPVGDYNAYRNEYDETPSYANYYGNYIEVGGFASSTSYIKYANSGLKN